MGVRAFLGKLGFMSAVVSGVGSVAWEMTGEAFRSARKVNGGEAALKDVALRIGAVGLRQTAVVMAGAVGGVLGVSAGTPAGAPGQLVGGMVLGAVCAKTADELLPKLG